MKKVYLVIGKAQNGKDTVAEKAMSLLEGNGKKCDHKAFARLLKEQALSLGWNGEKDDAGRTFLQHLGDIMKEYHGKDYYAGHVLGQILTDVDDKVYFITDCRFKIELELFKNCPLIDAKTIRIVRKDFVSPLTKEQQNHPSEIDLDDIKEDYLIMNDGEREELDNKIKDMLESL